MPHHFQGQIASLKLAANTSKTSLKYQYNSPTIGLDWTAQNKCLTNFHFPIVIIIVFLVACFSYFYFSFINNNIYYKFYTYHSRSVLLLHHQRQHHQRLSCHQLRSMLLLLHSNSVQMVTMSPVSMYAPAERTHNSAVTNPLGIYAAAKLIIFHNKVSTIYRCC